MDHYKVLKVHRDADTSLIRRQYLSLARDYHPDKNPGDAHAHTRFIRIGTAYEVLSDPALRQAYDRQLDTDPSPPTQAPSTRPRAKPTATTTTTTSSSRARAGYRKEFPRAGRPTRSDGASARETARPKPSSTREQDTAAGRSERGTTGDYEDELTKWKKLFQQAHEANRRYEEEEKRGIINDVTAGMEMQFPGSRRRPFSTSQHHATHTASTTSDTLSLHPDDIARAVAPLQLAQIFTAKALATKGPSKRYSLWVSKDRRYVQWRVVGKASHEPDGGLALKDVLSVDKRKRKGASEAQTLAISTVETTYNFDASDPAMCDEWYTAFQILLATR